MKDIFFERQSDRLTMLSVFIIFLVSLQLWLLMATMNAYLAQDFSILLPALCGSFVCFLLNFTLFFYIK